MRRSSVLPFVRSLLAFTVYANWGAAFAQTPPNICDLIDQLGIEKQLNSHAYGILVACGHVPPPPPASSSEVSISSPTNMGGVDQDVVLGGEGTYPHVTQSETQIWTEGTTSIVAYNDSRTAGSCYAGASYSTDRGATCPDGTVFVAGMDEGSGGLSSRLNYVFRSTNGGTSWSQIQMGSS